jgi:hypothetical protein
MNQTQPVIDISGNIIDGKKKKRRTISIRRFKVNKDGTHTLISHEKPRSKSAIRTEQKIIKAD